MRLKEFINTCPTIHGVYGDKQMLKSMGFELVKLQKARNPFIYILPVSTLGINDRTHHSEVLNAIQGFDVEGHQLVRPVLELNPLANIYLTSFAFRASNEEITSIATQTANIYLLPLPAQITNFSSILLARAEESGAKVDIGMRFKGAMPDGYRR